jgi:hypothetical protein
LVFEPISLDRQADYKDLLNSCPQIASDYSFLNLWAWVDEYGLCWAWEDNLVWIRQTIPHELFWAPVGPWDQIDWRTQFIENQNRKPVDIINIECHFLVLDNNGQIDITETNNEMRCMGDLIDLPNIKNDKSNVLNVQRRFAKKKYRNVYKWELTPQIEALIYDEIFNKTSLHIVK